MDSIPVQVETLGTNHGGAKLQVSVGNEKGVYTPILDVGRRDAMCRLSQSGSGTNAYAGIHVYDNEGQPLRHMVHPISCA